MRRIGAIGDIHCEDELLAAAIAYLEAEGVDQLVSVGDIVDRGHGDPNVCCELLRDNAVLTVRGNHERWLLGDKMRDLPDSTMATELTPETVSFLTSLPTTVELDTDGGSLLLCHGIGDNDMSRVNPDDEGFALDVNEDLQDLIRDKRFRYVIGGHTHHRMVRSFGDVTIINAGTLYQDHEPCFVLVDVGAGTVQFYDLDEGGRIHKAGSSVTM